MLFEILSGLRKPTTGKVLLNVNGEMLETKPGYVGVVQQSYPLFEHRTLWDNLVIAAKAHNSKKDAVESAKNLISRFDLEGKEKLYPRSLSGGQRQRAAIAQQIICTNGVLLMDEPLSGLDIQMIKKTSKLISEIAASDEKMTIIIVSHDLISLAAICDSLIGIGRDRDVNGKVIPGAYIKWEYDLKALDLAWKPDIKQDPRFIQMIEQIEERFELL